MRASNAVQRAFERAQFIGTRGFLRVPDEPYFFVSGQREADIGWKASAAGIVAFSV